MKRLFLTSILLLSLSSCATTTQNWSQPLTPQRQEHVTAYMNEFASGSFRSFYTNIGQALENALNKLPEDVFADVTDRRSPIIFINSVTSGIARYANGMEFFFRPQDQAALQDGFYLIVLGDQMNNFDNVEAIEGVIAHEIAHDWLKHLRAPKHNCEMEREANRLIMDWGYEDEYRQASETFGAKKKGDSPCADYFAKKELQEKSQNPAQNQ